MNNLTSLFPTNFKNLEQAKAIKLLEDIYKASNRLIRENRRQRVINRRIKRGRY